ncbi:MAG: TerC family protein [Cytophagales bacterium]
MPLIAAIQGSSLLSGKSLVTLLTLVLAEIVLGIDNVIFVSIITGKLPRENQPKARVIGLILALFFRILLLLGITYLSSFDENPLFVIGGDASIPEAGFKVTGKTLIMFLGGAFLLFKSISEIIETFHISEDDDDGEDGAESKTLGISAAIIQIIFIDIVFSIDSILAAVSLAKSQPEIMVAAVIVSVAIMLAFSGPISDFVNRQPTIRMLALCFLVVVSVKLLMDAFRIHFDENLIYASLGFALIVELLNMLLRRLQKKHEEKENIVE